VPVTNNENPEESEGIAPVFPKVGLVVICSFLSQTMCMFSPNSSLLSIT
jgi:hypothetical protein